MEPSGRNAAFDLDIEGEQALLVGLPSNVHQYNFYQLVELLRREHICDVESDYWEKDCQLIFSANPSLGFAASDVASVHSREDGRLIMLTNFFGLSGAQSPLPGFITEQLVNEDVDGLRQPLFDFFNNRLINLVYRIWRKYRYYVRFQQDAQDIFSSQLFALVGLGDKELRGDTPINWCKMLAYISSIAGRNRSPQVVAGVIAHYFELPHVEIRQWVKRKVNIENSQKLSLGKRNVQLGVNSVIGEFAMDCKGKFSIVISQLSLNRFRDFLPSGKEFGTLCKLVELMLREQLAYDLELLLAQGEQPVLSLCSSSHVALGWTSFLGSDEPNKRVLIQVRQ